MANRNAERRKLLLAHAPSARSSPNAEGMQEAEIEVEVEVEAG